MDEQQTVLEEEEVPECACGSEIEWLIEFFGAEYQSEHIKECPDCHQQTLHIGDEWQRCVHPACTHRAWADAEGNQYDNGVIVSNGGKSIDQMRGEYFDGSAFLVG